MLVSAFKKHVAVFPIKIVRQPATRNLKKYLKPTAALPVESFSVAKKQRPPISNKQRRFLSSPIFKITFTYLQKVVHMKVLKVAYFGGESIYEIALDSNLSKNIQMCWLQYKLQNSSH